MNKRLDDSKPIFQQVRERIEDQIINGVLKEGEQAPSTNQLVNFYKINHVTVSKGVNQLVDEGILFKKRGIGMFVAEGARRNLIEKRKEAFIEQYVIGLVKEADQLGITLTDLIEIIKKVKEDDSDDI